jgi:hypothetical protein
MAERPSEAQYAAGETQTAGRPTGPERFAAALAASRGTAARPQAASAPRRVRKARLRLTHVDPWSVLKTALLLSIALGVVTIVAVGIVWGVLGAAGVWDSVDSTVGTVVGGGSTFRIEDYVGMTRVMGFTMIVAVVDVILVTVLATLGAFLYNLAAALLGGIEVVLAEDDR